ncbi:hypothetical protein D3C81_2041080 [compost metagenome]
MYPSEDVRREGEYRVDGIGEQGEARGHPCIGFFAPIPIDLVGQQLFNHSEVPPGVPLNEALGTGYEHINHTQGEGKGEQQRRC